MHEEPEGQPVRVDTQPDVENHHQDGDGAAQDVRVRLDRGDVVPGEPDSGEGKAWNIDLLVKASLVPKQAFIEISCNQADLIRQPEQPVLNLIPTARSE